MLDYLQEFICINYYTIHLIYVLTVLGTNMPVVTGGVGGVMGLIILTQIAVIVVLFLRQNAKGKANKR